MEVAVASPRSGILAMEERRSYVGVEVEGRGEQEELEDVLEGRVVTPSRSWRSLSCLLPSLLLPRPLSSLISMLQSGIATLLPQTTHTKDKVSNCWSGRRPHEGTLTNLSRRQQTHKISF